MSKGKVLLIYPHFFQSFEHYWIPTSFVYIGSVLKAGGYEPILIDDRLGRKRALNLFNENIEDAKAVLIAAATGRQLHHAVWWGEQVPKHIPIIVGGPQANATPRLLEWMAEYVVVGRGEWVVLALLEDGEKEGIYSEADIVKPEDFPRLPYFDSQFFDVRDYLNPKTMAINYARTTGCVGDCTFCHWPKGYRFQSLPLEIVVDDLTKLRDTFGIREIQFDDPTFFISPQHNMPLVHAMKGMKLTYRANARVDTLRRFSLRDMREIYDSGCRVIHIGFEAGSDSVLERMHKRTKGRDVFSLLPYADMGIQLRFHVLLGTPGETLDELRETANVLNEMRQTFPDFDYTVNFFTPYPGNAMTEQAVRLGYKAPKEIEDYEMLEATNFPYLPTNDRRIVKEFSPWHNDYDLPWFPDNGKEYMNLFRELIPERTTILTTGQVRERIFQDE
ncbi:MAG: B12-binding domain-containing radical SAM protein [Sphaerochaeta sp.]|jgi:radical SAM superfamily enzyme YgiQ (UPF0313 family)|nr:B12-binding domain-containing radical SAM protein [Sphaerochaeta sp.]